MKSLADTGHVITSQLACAAVSVILPSSGGTGHEFRSTREMRCISQRAANIENTEDTKSKTRLGHCVTRLQLSQRRWRGRSVDKNRIKYYIK